MQKSTNYKRLVVGLFLLTGTISTFAYKLQGSVHVDQGKHHKKFFHPYLQSFSMFVGESLCLLLFFLSSANKQQVQQGKLPYRPFIFFIPALADSCSSILQYMGLSFISGSTYMMFKGASIVTTAIFSKILIKMVIQKRHIYGCGLAILGICIVGSSGFLQSDSSGESTFDKQFVGYVLMLISLIFNGFFYAYQNYLLKKHSINPMKMVGFQGIFGLCILTCVITVLSFIPCQFNDNCVYDNNNNPFFELPLVFLRQITDHITLLILFIIGISSIALYNLNGLKITKLFDALTRSLLNVTKTSVVWIVGIIITLSAEGNSALKLQSLNVGVNLVKAVGFSTIIFGTLIYNKLILKQYFKTVQKDQGQVFKSQISKLSSIQSSDSLNQQFLSKGKQKSSF